MKPILWVLVIASSAFSADSYFPTPDTKEGWRTLTGAEIQKTAGIDKHKLDEAFDYVQTTTQHAGLLVVRHGYLVYERYFGRGDREALPELASCGKAFTTVAVGIMLRDNASQIPYGLDEKIFTPKYLPEQYFPLDDPRKAQITLGQVLAMSAGIRGTSPMYVKGVRKPLENPAQDGPIATTDDVAMRQTLACDPGDCYSYATSSPHIAAMMVRKVTGMEMEDFMRKKLTVSPVCTL
jgi:CubicO group peptidase (beta-lactamase class C family)